MSDKEFLILKVIIKLEKCYFNEIKKYFSNNSDSTIKTHLGRLANKKLIAYDVIKGKNLYYSNVDKEFLLKYQIDNIIAKNCNLDLFDLLSYFLNKVELTSQQKSILTNQTVSKKSQQIKCDCHVCLCSDCKK